MFALSQTGLCLSIFLSKSAREREKSAQVGWHILSVRNECNEQAIVLISILRVAHHIFLKKKSLCEELYLTSAEHISFLMQMIQFGFVVLMLCSSPCSKSDFFSSHLLEIEAFQP